MTENNYAVDASYALPFGAIISAFARFERLIEVVAAHAMGTDIGAATIALSGLGYGPKCEAAIALIGVYPPHQDPTLAEEIKALISKFNERSPLRNHIAHRIWKHGNRPNTIKPFGLSVRGKLKGYGMSDDDIDYSVDELIDIADELVDQYDNARAFLDSKGIIPIIARNTDATNSGSNKSPDPSSK
jgi:hypothetical protein